MLCPSCLVNPDYFGKDFEFVSMLQNNGVVIAQTGSIQKSEKGVPSGVSMVGGNKDVQINRLHIPVC